MKSFFSCRASAVILTASLLTLPAFPAAPLPFSEGLFQNPATGVGIDLISDSILSHTPDFKVEEGELIRGLVAQISENPEGAIAELQRHATPEASALLDYILGMMYHNNGDLEKALASYRTAVRKFPNYREVYRNIGIIALMDEKYDDALRALVRSVELGDDTGANYGLIGFVYTALQNFAAAEGAYRMAMMKDPATRDWQVGLANSLMLQGKHPEGAAILQELLAKDTTNRDFWRMQANAFISLDEPMQAAYNFEILSRMGLAGADIYNMLGNIYLIRELPDLALVNFLISIDQENRPDVNMPIAAAEVIAARGEIENANILLAKIAKRYPNELVGEAEIKVLRLRAQIALAGDDDEAARQALTDLVEKQEDDGATMLLLANFNARAGKYEEARPYFLKAAELEGFEAQARVQHAQALVNQERYSEALTLLEEAQYRDPQPHVSRYLEEVRRVSRTSGT